MSSSEFDEKRSTMSSRMYYHSSIRGSSTMVVDEFLGSSRPGPDVTLATNAMSTLALQQQQQHQQQHHNTFHPSPIVKNSGQESPDLVNTSELLVEGATATGIYHEPPSTSVSAWKTSPQQRMSQSYCTGPSHMYL